MKNGTASKLESGQLAELASAIVRQLPHIEGLGEVAQGWIENGATLRKALRTALVSDGKEHRTNQRFTLLVNYDLRIEAAIKDGKYDWKNDNITDQHFPTKRTGSHEMEIKLFHFNRVIKLEQAIAEMDKQGYRPVEPHELLALGAKHPELQEQFPVIALGSVWQDLAGSRRVPVLSGDGDGRGLDLDCFDYRWCEVCRFAAVRKSR